MVPISERREAVGACVTPDHTQRKHASAVAESYIRSLKHQDEKRRIKGISSQHDVAESTTPYVHDSKANTRDTNACQSMLMTQQNEEGIAETINSSRLASYLSSVSHSSVKDSLEQIDETYLDTSQSTLLSTLREIQNHRQQLPNTSISTKELLSSMLLLQSAALSTVNKNPLILNNRPGKADLAYHISYSRLMRNQLDNDVQALNFF
eukprot:13931620-Ditylum_brightwellii.AAC.1